ncbi:tail tape measure protein [Altericroceibacterium endophyticum]|uniref:Tail tape measure protein n=1 Tax=Altericroceibacterium endophyticum TaxID=1808508 RepID=A0A6I4T511_9SPHN|nr:tail tape measure protein [Altericroceibacterium endophyticum]MXO65499.1 tail tape measure protein [Altericroceibacterium endophyticum]
MDDDTQVLTIAVEAETKSFREEMQQLRANVDGTFSGFGSAGAKLEKSLLSAIRQGNLAFDDLKQVALSTLEFIAAEALKIQFGGPVSGTGSGGLGTLVQSALTSLIGAPGRATGGPVSPQHPYLVGERGPEVFVPTSAGRVETASAPTRNVKVAVQLSAPRGTDAPTALQRSSRQLASSLRRALIET